MTAQRSDRGGVRVIQVEPRAHRPCPLRKQLHRRGLRHGSERRDIRRWDAEGVNRQLVFIAEFERRAAGGQDLQFGAGGQEVGDQVCHRGCEVLAVVKQQQRLPRAQESRQFRRNGVGRGSDERERRGQRVGHECRIHDRRQVDPDHPIGKGGGHVLGDSQCEPCLADATWTDKGQEGNSLVEQQRPGRGPLILPADEACAWHRRRSELKR